MRDEGEHSSLFEPLIIGDSSPHRSQLADSALELATRATALRAALPPAVATALAALIRSMNCYYSNLIEGHNTHPIDIERALKDDYSQDPHKRDLQLEAKAHIVVQTWIDGGGLSDISPTDPNAIKEIHRRFCAELPPELLAVRSDYTERELVVVPGQFRQDDVEVGRHVAISPGAVPRFLERFHQRYSSLGKIDSILAAACAHHRLLWVHPFLDGNGRVARLMSHAMLLNSLDTNGLWSISRGLARQEATYKRHLMACDSPRHGDTDGRGNLSEKALADFAGFFLNLCIDQVAFMENLMSPSRFIDRVMSWTKREIESGALPSKSDIVLRAILNQGTLGRGEVATLLGVNERTARRISSALLKAGALTSESTRAPLELAMPASLAPHWVPGLFPDQ